MKKLSLGIGGLLFVATLVYAFAGDIGVSTSIAAPGAVGCFPPQRSYAVEYTLTNYNISNATATNVTYSANITDDGLSVYTTSGTRYLNIGATYSWKVNKCTTGNQTNHTIVSRILKTWPTDSNSGNDYAIATCVV